MRPRLVEPLPSEGLGSRPINGLVRDYPELEEVLRANGVAPGTSGGRGLGEVLPDAEERGQLVSEMAAALRWRQDAGERGAVILPASDAPQTR